MHKRAALPLVPLVLAGVGPVAASTPAAADTARSVDNDQCVIDVIGQEKDGRYITTTPTCYQTLADALSAAGVEQAVADDVKTGADIDRDAEAVMAAGVIGVHWDGANLTGPSIVISGSNCGGGYVDLSSTWINRISSTSNYCPVVRFFDGYQKTGAFEQTGYYGGNLGALNNRANSISYGS